jgi:hypothetical protein
MHHHVEAADPTREAGASHQQKHDGPQKKSVARADRRPGLVLKNFHARPAI